MRYITVYQEVLDIISYVENENPDRYNVLGYTDFIKYLSNFPLKYWPEFLKELNSFKIIEINLETGEWEVINLDKNFTDYTFEELYQLNVTNKEEKKDAIQSALDFVDNRIKKIRGTNKK